MVIGFVNKVRDRHKYILEATYDRYECASRRSEATSEVMWYTTSSLRHHSPIVFSEERTCTNYLVFYVEYNSPILSYEYRRYERKYE